MFLYLLSKSDRKIRILSLFRLKWHQLPFCQNEYVNFKKKSLPSPCTGLSSFDLLYLFIAIFIFGLPAISSHYSRKVYVYIMPIGFGFGHIGRVGSVFVTMSVTIERYFAIVHPLKHFSGKKFLLMISTIASILYNIPKFYELERKVRGVWSETFICYPRACTF